MQLGLRPSAAMSIGPAKTAMRSCSCSRSAAATRTAPPARSCSCTVRRWRHNRHLICRSRAGPIPRSWTGSPAVASIGGAWIWRAMGARPRIATTMPRLHRGPTIVWRPRLTSSACAASGHCSFTAFRRAHCARLYSRSATRSSSPGWRSTPWCGPARAHRRLPSGKRNFQNSRPRTGGRLTRRSFIRSSIAIIPARRKKSHRRIRRCRHCARQFGADRHLCRHVQQTPGGGP